MPNSCCLIALMDLSQPSAHRTHKEERMNEKPRTGRILRILARVEKRKRERREREPKEYEYKKTFGRAHLLHATSVVHHAAFEKGKPFAGSFGEIQRVDVLRRSFERDFLPTLRRLRRDAYFFGLGPSPAAALSFAADKGS